MKKERPQSGNSSDLEPYERQIEEMLDEKPVLEKKEEEDDDIKRDEDAKVPAVSDNKKDEKPMKNESA